MEMKDYFLILILTGLLFVGCVDGQEENNTTASINVTTEAVPAEPQPGTLLTRGEYPYLALIYFMDDTVKSRGFRFLRAGVLIKADSILTASLPVDIQNEEGFPRKTLLARLGRVSTDDWMDINADAGEQEREVIKIYRPMDYDASTWWLYDVAVMSLVTPLEMTRTVNIAPLETLLDFSLSRNITNSTTCFSIVFHTPGDSADMKSVESVLMKMPVNLIESESECGANYNAERMICSSGSGLLKGAGKPYGECLANSGSPLICNHRVLGTQTYITPGCSPPHLYHRVEYWKNFFECGINDDCKSTKCSKLCVILTKDKDEQSKSATLDAEEHSHLHVNEESQKMTRRFKVSGGLNIVQSPLLIAVLILTSMILV